MKLGRQPATTTQHNWPRISRQVEDFTPVGKHCIRRLQEQVRLRLPAPSASQCLSVLLDPATKQFAQNLLDEGELYLDTHELLKSKHRTAYKAFYAPAEEDTAGKTPEEKNEEMEEELATPVEMTDDNAEYDDDILGMTCQLVADVGAETEDVDLDKDADEVFDKWMIHTVQFYKYVFDDKSHPLPESGQCSFRELVSKFDTMKYFRETGTKDWPTITILARIHFSKMDNSSFQERVFSTAENVQSKMQNRMAFEHLEMRTLISHNKDLIRNNII